MEIRVSISSPYFDRLNERLYFVTRNYDSNNDGSIDIKDDGHLWSADWVKDRLVNFSPVYFANREIISSVDATIFVRASGSIF